MQPVEPVALSGFSLLCEMQSAPDVRIKADETRSDILVTMARK